MRTLPCGVEPVLEETMCVRTALSTWTKCVLESGLIKSEDGSKVDLFGIWADDPDILKETWIASSGYFSRMSERAFSPIMTPSPSTRQNLQQR